MVIAADMSAVTKPWQYQAKIDHLVNSTYNEVTTTTVSIYSLAVSLFFLSYSTDVPTDYFQSRCSACVQISCGPCTDALPCDMSFCVYFCMFPVCPLCCFIVISMDLESENKR